MRKSGNKVTLCQLVIRVRSFDWTVGADLDNFLFPSCPTILGLTDVPGHKGRLGTPHISTVYIL